MGRFYLPKKTVKSKTSKQKPTNKKPTNKKAGNNWAQQKLSKEKPTNKNPRVDNNWDRGSWLIYYIHQIRVRIWNHVNVKEIRLFSFVVIICNITTIKVN